ncbi:MAG: hypothetical protein J2P28_21195 [Actinobacteria bacterium]|nr:hypothetical protein [Actinomycetota bacterium]
MANDEVLDARQAADLLQRSADHARQRLVINQPLIYGVWGVAWLVGCGAMWLSVIGQHPFRGAAGWASAILGTGIGLAIVATAITTSRATRGIGGVSARQGMIYGLSWPTGFAAMFTIIGAAVHFGASASLMGVLGAAAPLVLVGLIYVLAAGMWLDWVMFWLGLWELLVAAIGAWTGPVSVLLMDAVAGGGGFLAASALLARRNRS